ncbi:MAG: rod shape-determining protein MreD [Alphaproteobacteria bacterium]
MTTSLWERLVQSLRLLFPIATSVLMICLANVYLPNPLLIKLMPVLVYPAVWFWLIRRPDLMHFALIFFLGIMSDLLSANLVGVTPLCLLVLYRIVEKHDRFFRLSSGFVQWLCFFLFVFTSLCLEWLVNSILYWNFLPPSNFATKAVTTALVLPIITVILSPIDRFILGAKDRNF